MSAATSSWLFGGVGVGDLDALDTKAELFRLSSIQERPHPPCPGPQRYFGCSRSVYLELTRSLPGPLWSGPGSLGLSSGGCCRGPLFGSQSQGTVVA